MSTSKQIKEAINRTAHVLTQRRFGILREELISECAQMQKNGATEAEVLSHLLTATQGNKYG
jgi:hypothetical protein